MLLQAASPVGHGVLVRLRYADSLGSAVYRAIAPGEYSTPGAQVAVRYMVRDVVHGFFVDSGSVEVRRGRRDIDARGGGWGLEGSIRTRLTVEYAGVPIAADTVQCRYEP